MTILATFLLSTITLIFLQRLPTAQADVEQVSADQLSLLLQAKSSAGKPAVLTYFHHSTQSDQTLAHDFLEAANQLRQKQPHLTVAQHLVQNAATYRTFDLKFVPCIKMFHGPTGTTFLGRHNADRLITWATHFSSSPVTQVYSESAWAEVRKMFRSPTSVSFLVGAFAEDGPGYDAFRDAAIYDEIPFVAIRDKSLMDLLDLSDRSIVMFKDNNWLAAMPDSATSTKGYSSSTSLMSFSTESNAINRVQYKGDVTNSPEIDSFVTHNQLPLVVQYSVISARKLFAASFTRFVLLFAFEKTGSRTSLLQTFLKAAKFMRPKETGSTRRVFVSVPSYEEEAWRYFGVDDADSPCIVFYNSVDISGGMQKLENADAISTASMMRHLIGPNATEEFLRSESEIKTESSGIVHAERDQNSDSEVSAEKEKLDPSEIQLVTDQSFENVVEQVDKDVLVLFNSEHADSYNSQNMEALLRSLRQLARDFSTVESLQIVSMAKNPFPLRVSGSNLMPKEQFGLILFRADDKHAPVRFSGTVHSADAIFRFVKSCAQRFFILGDGRLGGSTFQEHCPATAKKVELITSSNARERCNIHDGDDRCHAESESNKLSELRAWFSRNQLTRWSSGMIDALGAESLDDLQFITVSDMKALHMPVIQQRKFFAAYQSSGLPTFTDQTTDAGGDRSEFQEDVDNTDEDVPVTQARVGNRQRVRRKRWRELNNPSEDTISQSETREE